MINEAYQRRNIFAHNNGIVNARYLRSVAGLPAVKEIKLGERLGVNWDYFFQVYWEILASGIVLAQSCWRKWYKENSSDADSVLVDCINRELLQQAVVPATRLCLYSREIETSSKETKYDLDALFCQLLKIVGLKEKFTQEIRKLEKVGSGNKQLADIAALKDDKEAFYEHMKSAVKNKEVYESDFGLVAIYQDLHSDEDFKKKLDEMFKHQ